MGIVATVMTISPRMAAQWLTLSNGNRSISSATVNKYANDMIARRWKLNGETIVFDKNNVLRNGHHRLSAIVKADASVKSLVVTGIDPDECAVMDVGRVRTLRDTMRINGICDWKSNVCIHGCVRMYFKICENNFAPSYDQIVEFIDANESELKAIYDHVHIGGGNQNLYFCKRSPIVFALLSAIKFGISEQTIWKFMESLNSGIIEGKKESSVIKLRNQLISKKLDSLGGSNSAMTFATENAIRDYANRLERVREYKDCKPVYSDKVWKNG